jgi:hypothetical protein
MRDIYATFEEDYFSDRNITVGRLLKFGLTVEQRLAGDNPAAQFTPLITQLRTLRKSLETDYQRTDQSLSQRGGSVEVQNSKLMQLAEYLLKDTPLIHYRDTKFAGLTDALLPNGLTEYREANLQTADTLFNRVIQAGTDFQEQLTDEFDTARYQQLYDDFDKARGGVGKLQQAISQGRTGVKTTRDLYTQALTLSVKTVALAFPHEPLRCRGYFPQELLRRPARPVEGVGGKLPAAATLSALPEGLDPTDEPFGAVLAVENTGSQPFRACLSDVAGEVCPPDAPLVAPGTKAILTYDPANGVRYLNLTNQTAREGRYHLRLKVYSGPADVGSR